MHSKWFESCAPNSLTSLRDQANNHKPIRQESNENNKHKIAGRHNFRNTTTSFTPTLRVVVNRFQCRTCTSESEIEDATKPADSARTHPLSIRDFPLVQQPIQSSCKTWCRRTGERVCVYPGSILRIARTDYKTTRHGAQSDVHRAVYWNQLTACRYAAQQEGPVPVVVGTAIAVPTRSQWSSEFTHLLMWMSGPAAFCVLCVRSGRGQQWGMARPAIWIICVLFGGFPTEGNTQPLASWEYTMRNERHWQRLQCNAIFASRRFACSWHQKRMKELTSK